MRLKGKVDTQEITIKGTGKYNAQELESSDCIVKILGTGSATVHVKNTLSGNISGVGTINYLSNPKINISKAPYIGTVKKIG